MTVKGDFRKLDRLIRNLDPANFAGPELQEQLAEEAIDLIHDGFEESEDPYGNKWAALEARAGKPLQDNRQLQTSFHVAAVTTDSFTVSAGVWYAIVHQQGWAGIKPKRAKLLAFPRFGKLSFAKSVDIPARPMVPDEHSIPAKWIQRFRETAADFILMKINEGL